MKKNLPFCPEPFNWGSWPPILKPTNSSET
jgi:hypothetical protein